MAVLPYSPHAIGVSGPAQAALVITPSDTTDLDELIRAITIGTTGGALSYVNWEGDTCTTDFLPVGTYPLLARRVRATGTSATGLTGWV